MSEDRQQLLEQAREALDYVASLLPKCACAFGQIHRGCGFEKVRILRDLLAALEAAPDARTPVPPELYKEAQRAARDRDLREKHDAIVAACKRKVVLRDLLPHLRPEGERLTREECWQELREAWLAARKALPEIVFLEMDSLRNFKARSAATGAECFRPDPIAALRALAKAANPQSPDFAGMSEQERKAWLRERGRLEVLDETDGSTWARLLKHNERGCPIANATAADEPAALLALCERVAAKECGEDDEDAPDA